MMDILSYILEEDNVLFGKLISVDGIRDELILVDDFCRKENISAKFAIIGGAAGNLLLSLRGYDFRQTRDIDIGGLESTNENVLLSYLKTRSIEPVDGFLIPDIDELLNQKEYNLFDDGYTNIEVVLPSVEMWVCLKALTNRDKDFKDIMDSGVLDFCDHVRTIELINEYKGDTMNDNPLYYHFEEVLQHLHKLSQE